MHQEHLTFEESTQFFYHKMPKSGFCAQHWLTVIGPLFYFLFLFYRLWSIDDVSGGQRPGRPDQLQQRARHFPFRKTNCLQHFFQCSGSVIFWSGSGSLGPYFWFTDSAPDPALFVSDFQDAKKISVFLICFICNKKSLISHNTGGIKVLFTFLRCWWKDLDPEPEPKRIRTK